MANNPPTNEEEAQVKEFLSRAEIRTMKKDLQKLREEQVLKERERIVKLKTPEEERIERERLLKIREEKEERERITKEALAKTEILQRGLREEKEVMKQIKDYASEEERQQIFYLEAEKLNLEKQLQALQKEKEPPILLEKNKLLLERSDIEEKLNGLKEEETKIEGEEKAISDAEKTTTAPGDKRKLEERRWKLEGEREKSEKRRWLIEKDLEKIENQIKGAEDEYQKVLSEEEVFKNKIEEVNNSLRTIYTAIMEGEEKKRQTREEEKEASALKRAEEEGKRKEEIRRREWTGKGKIEQKGFLKGVPAGPKEKLAEKLQKSAAKEEEERKRFLESIEEWAKEDKDK